MFCTGIVLLLCLRLNWDVIAEIDVYFNDNGIEDIDIPATPLNVSASNRQVVCYTPTWNTNVINRIDINLCTIFIIAFGTVDATSVIKLPRIKQYRGLKTPHSKLLLGITAQGTGVTDFRKIARSPSLRLKFAENCYKTVINNGLDGVDIDWEFPIKTDRRNFILLLQTIKKRFEPNGYLLTSAVGVGYWLVKYLNVYDIQGLSNTLDYINLMAYDMHMDAAWDKATGVSFNAPINAIRGDSVTKGIKYFLDSGAPSNKLVLGVPFYSRAYELEDPSKVTPGSPFIVGHQTKNSSYTKAYVSYCRDLKDANWRKNRDPNAQAPYMYRDRTWVSYEDTESIKAKTRVALQYNLAGVMVWAITHDDYINTCGDGYWPLLKTINYTLNSNL